MKIMEWSQGENWPGDFDLAGNSPDWNIRKKTLQGGLSHGLEIIQVCNGPWEVTILPGKGMGLWRGKWNGNFIGWNSPVSGPVNPNLIELERRNGLGWLDGFDEWFCRCGLISNGPPGVGTNGQRYTLHGRIANLPASQVKIEGPGPSRKSIRITGVIEETSLFSPKLRLTTCYEFPLGQNFIQVEDRVENIGDSSAEMQMLYHCNIGSPLLGPKTFWTAPLSELAPQTNNAAKGVDSFSLYGLGAPGYQEQVFLCKPIGDQNDWSLASLYNPENQLGFSIRFQTTGLPCFTVWKNLGGTEEGYVTGLEPATNYPNFIDFERSNGRVVMLPPKSSWTGFITLETYKGEGEFIKTEDAIRKLQTCAPHIHKTPTLPFSPVP